MRFINTKIHGIFDYCISVILIALPFVFNMDKQEAESWILISMGISQIPIIFFTKYEVGVIGSLKVQHHLILDLIAGIFLAISPWTFMFHERVFLPHLCVGIAVVLMSLITIKESPRMNREAFDSSKA